MLLVVLAGAGLLLLGRLDLAGFAAGRAEAALGRKVAIGSLHVTPGRWLRIEVEGLRIGNIEGGTRPEMVELGRAGAEVELVSLLRGPPVLRGVELEKLSVLLERTADRTRNWRFGAPRPKHEGPEDRSAIPTLLDAAIRDSELLFRTSSGHVLRTQLRDATIHTESDQAPLLLRAAGSYNDVPVALEGRLESIAMLRDAKRPFGTKLHLASGETTLRFDGTMADPLDVDGAEGHAVLRVPRPEAILALAGASDAELDASLDLEGRLEHHGDVWRLSAAKGQLAGEAVTVRLAEFTEGETGRPDAVAIDLGFGRLDLNKRLAAGRQAGRAEADLPLTVSAAPDPLLAARITVEELVYSKLRARDVAFEGSLMPGRIAVESFALTTSGARVVASGQVERRGEGGAVTAEVQLQDGDLDALRRAFGLRDLPLSGRLNGWVAVAAEGLTLNAAAAGARVSAVVAMQGGRIAREVIETASIDLRLLFRSAQGTTPVSCLLGMLEMRAGVGEVAPLRIRSAEGTLAGTASFDLNRRQVDLVAGSVRSTTDFWALDIPVRVAGSFASPSIRPARWSADGRARLAAADEVAPLPVRLRDFARRNPCYQAAAIPASPRTASPPPTTSRSRPR
ncbi:AsmA-like C-terminal region-containing protein [Dankookia sp. GCM10030260]|uniref:AsmA family protein n=1 Tax=Dankookia sp. GCM10030260 TaxID=3273390 RepID=UPI00360B178A